jgi:N utilization substance protein A
MAAGITTVEQVADMTPEQLEEIPGVGPKTIEKISIAVNNYFSRLDAPAEVVPEESAAGEEAPAGDEAEVTEEALSGDPIAVAEGQEESSEAEVLSGDTEGLPTEAEASAQSVEELANEGQYYEAEVVDGVESAPPADVAEVHTHERPEVQGESVPDQEVPGEGR